MFHRIRLARSLPFENPAQDGRQPVNDPDRLFAMAKQACAAMKRWLDEGHGICSRMGMSMQEGGRHNVPADGPHPWTLILPGIKGIERATAKVAEDYHGDWTRLLDVVRASIVVGSMAEVEQVCQALKQGGIRLARVPKDRFSNPTAVGYRDLMLNLTLPNGVVGELQIHLVSMLRAKAEGHTPYEVMRAIQGKYRESDPNLHDPSRNWTPEDQAAWKAAYKQSCAIYGKAWTEARRSKEGTMEDQQFRYYELEGAVYRKPADVIGGVQQVYSHKDAEWVPYTGDRTKPIVFGAHLDPRDVAGHTGERR